MFITLSPLWLIVLVGLSLTLGFVSGIAVTVKAQRKFRFI